MSLSDFIRLFRSILAPGVAVDAAEIERMGLLAVKIAQMYSVRADLLGEAKCLELSRLLQSTRPLAGDGFARRWDALAPARLRAEIARFDAVPLAAASLGQIHRATLRDGREVVVKLAKRDTREAFLRDARRFRRLLRVALFFHPKLERLADPMDALDTVERQTLREMDFRCEMEGAERLASLAAERADALPHLRKLRFPDYHPELGHDRLLVSGFVEGRTVKEWLDAGGLPYEALLDLFRIHGYFLFVRGEFHGDLHPGNIIWHGGNFWFLDNANIETVPPEFGRGLFRMMVLLGRGDNGEAAEVLAGLSTRPLSSSARAAFRDSFRALYHGFAGKTAAEASLTHQMMETVRMAVHAGIVFPRGAFPLIKSLMYLDGMVLRAAPQARLLEDVARFAGDFGG
jgi:ubiquinone biosynthesis protein